MTSPVDTSFADNFVSFDSVLKDENQETATLGKKVEKLMKKQRGTILDFEKATGESYVWHEIPPDQQFERNFDISFVTKHIPLPPGTSTPVYPDSYTSSLSSATSSGSLTSSESRDSSPIPSPAVSEGSNSSKEDVRVLSANSLGSARTDSEGKSSPETIGKENTKSITKPKGRKAAPGMSIKMLLSI